jgi:hypothetical protein
VSCEVQTNVSNVIYMGREGPLVTVNSGNLCILTLPDC